MKNIIPSGRECYKSRANSDLHTHIQKKSKEHKYFNIIRPKLSTFTDVINKLFNKDNNDALSFCHSKAPKAP